MKKEDIIEVLGRIAELPDSVDCTERVMKYGVDSISIMKLVSQFRRLGFRVKFAELMEEPTIDAWYVLLNQKTGNAVHSVPQAEASAENPKEMIPLIMENKEIGSRQEKFPDDTVPFDLTDVQYAYWAGRGEDQVLGGADCHAYYEFRGRDIDPVRLKNSWNLLQRKHRSLRTRITEGKQYIGEQPFPDSYHAYDYSALTKEEAEKECRNLRERLSHRKLKIEEGEVSGLNLCLLPEKEHLLILDFALIAADVKSIQILLRDLRRIYLGEAGAEEENNWNFRAYLERQKKERQDEYRLARSCWESRISEMPHGPELPLAKKAENIRKIRNTHYTDVLSKEEWNRIVQAAHREGATVPMVLLAAYAEVISCWSSRDRFLINIPLFDRAEEVEGCADAVSDFTTLLLLEEDFTEECSLSERIRQTQKRFVKEMNYAACSGVEVQRMMQKRFPQERVFAPVVFACNLGLDFIDDAFSQSLGTIQYMVSQTPQVWIDCQTFERKGELHISWDVCDELFPEGLPEEMFCTYIQYLKKMSSENDWNSLSLSSCIQLKNRKTAEETTGEYPKKGGLLTDGLIRMASEDPDRTALVSCETGERLSYGELYRRSSALSRMLQKRGVKKGAKAGVKVPRGIDQIIALYGILLSGGVYVPVSYSQPEARLKKIIHAADIRHIVTNEAEGEKIDGVEYICLHAGNEEVLETEGPAPEDTAYIIMTSGSTGEPKGVKITHQSAVNTILDVNRRNGIGSSDLFLSVSAIDFDLSVYDIFGCAAAGGCLYVLNEEHAKDADYWLKVVSREKITVWNSVPVLFQMLLTAAEASPSRKLSLRRIFLSGDWVSTALTEQGYKHMPDAVIVGMGGATEASIWSNALTVPKICPENWKHVPYGYALTGQIYRVVDSRGRDCPDWVTGELWIGGYGVAEGYAGDRMKTEEKFTFDQNIRWYHTGDLGRFTNEGVLEFLGRRDQQVKVRGHRIELGEIEAAAVSSPSISQAAAAVAEHRGQKQLVLYYAGEREISKDQLTEELKKILPVYMIPAHYVYLENLPVTANGKIDRKSLPEPLEKNGERLTDSGIYRSSFEKKLSEIWMETLQLKTVNREDDYFELGGDSLNATKAVAQIRAAFGVPFKIGQIFRYPSLAEMAEQIERLSEETAEQIERPQ